MSHLRLCYICCYNLVTPCYVAPLEFFRFAHDRVRTCLATLDPSDPKQRHECADCASCGSAPSLESRTAWFFFACARGRCAGAKQSEPTITNQSEASARHRPAQRSGQHRPIGPILKKQNLLLQFACPFRF